MRAQLSYTDILISTARIGAIHILYLWMYNVLDGFKMTCLNVQVINLVQHIFQYDYLWNSKYITVVLLRSNSILTSHESEHCFTLQWQMLLIIFLHTKYLSYTWTIPQLVKKLFQLIRKCLRCFTIWNLKFDCWRSWNQDISCGKKPMKKMCIH